MLKGLLVVSLASMVPSSSGRTFEASLARAMFNRTDHYGVLLLFLPGCKLERYPAITTRCVTRNRFFPRCSVVNSWSEERRPIMMSSRTLSYFIRRKFSVWKIAFCGITRTSWVGSFVECRCSMHAGEWTTKPAAHQLWRRGPVHLECRQGFGQT